MRRKTTVIIMNRVTKDWASLFNEYFNMSLPLSSKAEICIKNNGITKACTSKSYIAGFSYINPKSFGLAYFAAFSASARSFSHFASSASNCSEFIGFSIIFWPLYLSAETPNGEYWDSNGFNLEAEYPPPPTA